MSLSEDTSKVQIKVDYTRKWYVMAAVAMGIFLATIDSSIVNIALPTLVREFNTDFATIQWVVLVYLLTLATLILSFGRLGDMMGKKPVYATGFVVFTLGSILCGLSSTVFWLVFFRVVQAIGATMILALGMAIVTEAFPSRERGMALGISGSIVSIGIVLGPTLGGLIIDAWSWNWIFFVNIPVGIIGILMVLRFIPDIKPIGKQRFDLLGALTLFISVLSFLLALTFGQRIGFVNIRVLVLFATCALFSLLFVLIELRVTQPMIDLRLFKNKIFSISLVTGFLTFLAISGTIILIPFYLENVLGYNTRQIGLLLAAVPIAMGIVAPIAGSLSDRFGTRPIAVIGLSILLVGYYGLSKLHIQTSTLEYLIRFLPIGLGMGIFSSPNNSTIMGTAPRERLGIVSGMLAVNRTLGQTTGIAVLGAIWASRVIAYSGSFVEGGATNAKPVYQVAGLGDTFSVAVVVILAALGLSVLGYIQDRREKKSLVTNPSRE
ncbi:DHA2 family efflux MFS transporter permease subunit [Chloroflexota bacterium]